MTQNSNKKTIPTQPLLSSSDFQAKGNEPSVLTSDEIEKIRVLAIQAADESFGKHKKSLKKALGLS